MPIQIGGRLDRGFDDPVGLMEDCHRRIERFLDTLLTVVRQAGGGALNDLQREAMDQALRYFAGMAPKHTADEEESLFPRLRGRLDSVAAAQVQALEADHDRAEAAHADVERLGRRWLDSGRLEPEAAARLLELLEALRETYAAHIALEDGTVFPLAREILSAEQVAQVGREMAERRGNLSCSERKALAG